MLCSGVEGWSIQNLPAALEGLLFGEGSVSLLWLAFSIALATILLARPSSITSLLARFLLHVVFRTLQYTLLGLVVFPTIWDFRQLHLDLLVPRKVIRLKVSDGLISGRDDVDDAWSRCGPWFVR